MKFLKKQRIVLFVFLPVGLLVIGYAHQIRLAHLLSLYGVLSVGRIIIQSIQAAVVRHRKARPAPKRWQAVSIVVATFDEDPFLLRQAVASLADQDYPDFEVIVVDDGSPNPEVNRAIVEEHGATYIYQPNAGKRHAMYNAFKHLRKQSKFVLTADGDTVWKRNATRELVREMRPGVGAATGYVGVINSEVNWLTKVCDIRYYLAFNVERAAQASFGAVTCVSGPLGIYRRELIDQIKDEFVSQKFLGKPCTFGDDRHLTNLVLGLGYKVSYAPRAVCLSDCPTTLSKYLSQQARWGKSHWRELLWQFKALPNQSLYLSFEWIIALVLPFLLVASILRYSYLAVTDDPIWLIKLLGMLILMSLVRIIWPLIETRNPRFFYFVGYTVLNLVCLLPLKFYSLATINVTKWGTRNA